MVGLISQQFPEIRVPVFLTVTAAVPDPGALASPVLTVDLPTEFALHGNAPNPFRPPTTIRFDLPVAAEVSLTIYNVQGRRVCTLVQGRVEPGRHAAAWDGRDGRGQPVAAGVYFYRLRAAEFERTRKLVLLRGSP